MTNATTAAADAPLLIDDDNWHSIWCVRVRDSEIVEKNADIGDCEHCPVCELFCDPGRVGE